MNTTSLEPQSATDTDPAACPTGTCGTAAYAVFDPTDSFGALDRAANLPDPGSALGFEDVVARQNDAWMKFWMRFIRKYEDVHGREDLIRTGAMFMPGEDRSWYYKMRFNEIGTPYSASYGWTDHVSNNPILFSNYEPGIIATVPQNIFFDEKTLELFIDKEPSQLTDAELAQMARRMKQAINIEQEFASWARVAGNVLLIGVTAIALVTGVGAVIAASSLALKAAALVVLAIAVSDAVQVGTGYIGLRGGQGVNPLEEAAAFLGGGVAGDEGERAARTMYSMVNIAVGLKGKWRAVALLPAAAAGSGMFIANDAEGSTPQDWQPGAR